MLPPRDSSQAVQRPVVHAAAGHVPGAERGVVVAQRVEQVRQFLGGVRAVGVHLDDHVVRLLLRPAEPGDVRRAESFLAGPVQHLDVVVGDGEFVGDGTGAVG